MSAGPDPAIRVLVVDDHPIWREGTARYLSEAGYTIAGTAGDGAQALRIIAATLARCRAARPEPARRVRRRGPVARWRRGRRSAC